MTSTNETHTILLADDDPDLTAALSARLSKLGYQVHVAHDAYMALDAALKHHPDLLILDINMPAGDGFSVVDRLRNKQGSGQTPLIIVSGENSAARRAESHRHGAFAFLSKPFQTGELVKAIRQALHEERLVIPSPDEEYTRC